MVQRAAFYSTWAGDFGLLAAVLTELGHISKDWASLQKLLKEWK